MDAVLHPRIEGIGVLLRGELDSLHAWLEHWNARRLAVCLTVIFVGAGCYGAAMGFWRDPLQAVYVAVKFPLIILLTTFGNALINAMLAPLLGLNIGLRQSFLAILISFTIASAILGAFSPLIAFVIWNAPPLSSPTHQSGVTYSAIMLIHVAVIAFAGITNSAHVGVLGIHLLPVARAGLVGFAFTNSPAAIPPWGGKKPLFGTNPVAAVFPREKGEPLVIDLALTTVVRGRIMMAMRKGERIPEGWALDRNGKPTNDPKEAIEHGSLFPIGGAKGAMLALMFELICAALTGSAIGPEADSFFSEEGNRPRIGQAFIAIDPGALAGTAKYLERVETVVRTMLADAEVRLPGARRFAAEKSARAQGIEVPDELLAQIEKLAQ